MTRSMTAFASYETQTEQGTLSWEIRSVNHRYLESSFRLNEIFRPLEMTMRKRLMEVLGRGKIELSLRYQTPDQQTQIQLDEALAVRIINSYEQLAEKCRNAAPLDLMQVMRWPGVIQSPVPDQEALNRLALILLDKAIEDLLAMREREGAALQAMIETRCDQIDEIVRQVRERMPQIVNNQQQKLKQRVAALGESLDPERLEREIALLLQKADVAEELDRLKNHVQEVRSVLQRDESIGRRLDFLMQELNRETNTLGSKSIDIDITNYSVELKVLIEQMREQIQNIE